jgi:hypothetical protein
MPFTDSFFRRPDRQPPQEAEFFFHPILAPVYQGARSPSSLCPGPDGRPVPAHHPQSANLSPTADHEISRSLGPFLPSKEQEHTGKDVRVPVTADECLAPRTPRERPDPKCARTVCIWVLYLYDERECTRPLLALAGGPSTYLSRNNGLMSKRRKETSLS